MITTRKQNILESLKTAFKETAEIVVLFLGVAALFAAIMLFGHWFITGSIKEAEIIMEWFKITNCYARGLTILLTFMGNFTLVGSLIIFDYSALKH